MPVVTIPTSTAANIATTAGSQFSELQGIMILIGGVLLALLVVEALVSMIHGRAK